MTDGEKFILMSMSDPKTKKAYSKTLENPKPLLGKKIGEEIELGILGIEGAKAKITGGSDKQGFPMRADLEGANRKKIFIIKNEKEGIKQKVSRRGKVISEETAQVNLKLTKEGKAQLAEKLAKEADPKEEKISYREKAVKTSLENIGNTEGLTPKDVKGKVRG